VTTPQRIRQGRFSSLEGSDIFPVNDGCPGVHASWQRRVGGGLPVREVVVQIVERFQTIKTHRIRFLGDGDGDHAALNPFESLRVLSHGTDDDFACQVEPVHRFGRGAAGCLQSQGGCFGLSGQISEATTVAGA
jgi:hypothetical protein